MPKFTVRVRGSMVVNVWKDLEIEAEYEDEAKDLATDDDDLSGYHNDLTPTKIDIDDVTSVTWDDPEIVR